MNSKEKQTLEIDQQKASDINHEKPSEHQNIQFDIVNPKKVAIAIGSRSPTESVFDLDDHDRDQLEQELDVHVYQSQKEGQVEPIVDNDNDDHDNDDEFESDDDNDAESDDIEKMFNNEETTSIGKTTKRKTDGSKGQIVCKTSHTSTGKPTKREITNGTGN